jgi:hypothetical protein
MRGFDRLPPDVRAALNEVPISVPKARTMIWIHKSYAAEFIWTKYVNVLFARP